MRNPVPIIFNVFTYLHNLPVCNKSPIFTATFTPCIDAPLTLRGISLSMPGCLLCCCPSHPDWATTPWGRLSAAHSQPGWPLTPYFRCLPALLPHTLMPPSFAWVFTSQPDYLSNSIQTLTSWVRLPWVWTIFLSFLLAPMPGCPLLWMPFFSCSGSTRMPSSANVFLTPLGLAHPIFGPHCCSCPPPVQATTLLSHT